MVQAALDQTASDWRRYLAGPVLLADRGSEDAEVARYAAGDVAAAEGVPLRLEAFVRGVHRPVLVIRGQSASWPPRLTTLSLRPCARTYRVALRDWRLRVGAEVTSWVTTGEPIEVLLGLASDLRVLVAAGLRAKHHGVDRIVSALLHQAAGPVLIVPDRSRDVGAAER